MSGLAGHGCHLVSRLGHYESAVWFDVVCAFDYSLCLLKVTSRWKLEEATQLPVAWAKGMPLGLQDTAHMNVFEEIPFSRVTSRPRA